MSHDWRIRVQSLRYLSVMLKSIKIAVEKQRVKI